MENDWKNFWDRHVIRIPENKPFHQVARTLHQQAPSEDQFANILKYNIRKLALQADHEVLDFCCGNGLFSIEIARYCKQVVGIDFCEKLVATLNGLNIKNISVHLCHAMEAKFAQATFDRIFFSAALQHFSPAETIQLFLNFKDWLKPGGILFVTDILEAKNIWQFYDSKERQKTYFDNLKRGELLLGTWFDKEWLENLGYHCGFKKSEALKQPEGFWYAHYRFDLICYN